MYSNKKFDLAGEEWEVNFLPRVTHGGKWIAAGKWPEKRLILVSTRDKDGHILPENNVRDTFTKAITPIAFEIIKRNKEQQDGIQ